jgi:hypothetical protein
VPPAHQLASLLQSLAWLLYLNCNCCSQFTYHVITQITVSHFVSNYFFCFIIKNSTAPPLVHCTPTAPPLHCTPTALHPHCTSIPVPFCFPSHLVTTCCVEVGV